MALVFEPKRKYDEEKENRANVTLAFYTGDRRREKTERNETQTRGSEVERVRRKSERAQRQTHNDD